MDLLALYTLHRQRNEKNKSINSTSVLIWSSKSG